LSSLDLHLSLASPSVPLPKPRWQICPDNLVNGFQDWSWRRFCCSSIAPENRGADPKVQVAATETLREISDVTRKKVALNFLFTAADKLPACNTDAEILLISFGNIVPATFLKIFLVTTIGWV
jgi:hypothetical protein